VFLFLADLSLNNIDGRIKSELSGIIRPRLKTFHI